MYSISEKFLKHFQADFSLGTWLEKNLIRLNPQIIGPYMWVLLYQYLYSPSCSSYISYGIDEENLFSN